MTLNVFRFTGLNSSLALKAPVRCATLVNITLSGFQTIDGVALSSTDSNLRVLVKNQTTATQNGLYDAQSGTWTRCADWDSNDDFVQGTRVFVVQGSTQTATSWYLATSDPVILNTSAITFSNVPLSAAGLSLTATADNQTPLTISQFDIGQTAPLMSLAVGNSAAASGSWILWERPASVSFNGVPWREIVNQNYFAGGGVGGENYANEEFAMGWNLGATIGVPAVAGKAMVWDTWEYKFNSLSRYQSERHFQMLDVTGRTTRFNTYGAPHTGGGTGNSGFSNTLSVDEVVWQTGGPTLTVTGAVNNGGGLIRLSVATGQATGWVTGQRKNVFGVGGVPNATGDWVITVIDAQTIDLQNSTWAGGFTTGGTIQGSIFWQLDLNAQTLDLIGAPLIRANKNNVPILQQNNANASAFINLPYLNNNNEFLTSSPVFIQSSRNATPSLGNAGAILQFQQLSANSGDYLIWASLATVTGSLFAYSFDGNPTTGLIGELANGDSTHGTAHSTQLIRTNGSSSGDPRIQFQVDGVQNWTIGIDNDASQAFKISASTNLGTTDYLIINTAGAIANNITIAEVAGGSALTLTGATQTTSHPVLNASQTWNAGGVVFTGALLNITNTASAAGSRLVDFQLASSSLFYVDKGGLIGTDTAFSAGMSLSHSSQIALFGRAASMQSFLPNAGIGLGDTGDGTGFAVRLVSSGYVGWSSGNPTQTLDTFIGRFGAASIQLGAADAASPVAQTLNVQNVVAGTNNTNGANLTIKGSLSTGSGTSGDIIIQTGGTGAGASAQNTATTAVTIKGATQKTIFSNSALSNSSSGGMGYTTGAGGTVAQTTGSGKATAFTLSKITGQITFSGGALAAQATVSSSWTNAALAAADTVLFSHVSGGTIGAYIFNAAPSSGGAQVNITNISTSSLSESPVVNFTIMKGSTN